MTEYDIEFTRLMSTWQLLRSIEIYTLPNDTLVDLKSRGSWNGKVVIDCTINREGTNHILITDVIYAGGYNIQRLHYRYITKTDLKNQNTNVVAKQYEERIKRLSKSEKLNQEILKYEKRIENNRKEAEEAKSVTDDQILTASKIGKNYHEWPTWEEIVKRDAAKNYNNSEEQYNREHAENQKDILKFWKTRNITWKEENIKEDIKTINKLKIKLKSVIEA